MTRIITVFIWLGITLAWSSLILWSWLMFGIGLVIATSAWLVGDCVRDVRDTYVRGSHE